MCNTHCVNSTLTNQALHLGSDRDGHRRRSVLYEGGSPNGAWMSRQLIDRCCGITWIMDKIHHISRFGTRVHPSAPPLRALTRSGPFPVRRAVTVPRDDTETNALRFLERDTPTPEGPMVVSDRMSHRSRKDDRSRQVQAMKAYGRGIGLAVDVRRPARHAQALPVPDEPLAKRVLHHLSVVRLVPLPQAELL